MQRKPYETIIRRLPVAAVLQSLEKALEKARNAVLTAPPGAGKTTAVPLALQQASWLKGGRLLILEPRRLAARAAAHRLAALLGEPVGETVGYRIRLENRTGSRTRIEVVTEGILTRMLQSDPGLTGVGLVIFDEFHERSLDADLGLALCRELQGVLNADLRLLVMSATLDPAPVAALLGDAPLIQCEGRLFPVETRYLPFPQSLAPERAAVDTVVRSAAADEGNILVFLPGAPEIRRTARLLAEARLGDCWEVAPLYGRLSREAQDAAIVPPPPGRRKVVLASAIAETSLTIEGIRVVVDSGLQRRARFDPASGMTRLVTLPVSRASAAQRRGRAGRTEPGICYRLWSASRQAALPARNSPEILDADLSGLALELALWGVPSPGALAWLDPPPAGAFEQGRQLLAELGAIDNCGKITARGRRMAALPLHPRLAHMLLAALEEGMGSSACEVAAVLSERDPLHFSGGMRDADLRLRLDLLKTFKAGGPLTVPDGIADRRALGRILAVAAVLRRRLGLRGSRSSTAQAGRLLAWAYPDRVACRRPGSIGRYLMTCGRGAYFDPPDPLSASEFLVIAELDGERREARIFLAAPYDRDTLMEQFGSKVQRQEQVLWDDRRRAVTAERRLTLGALTLRREPLADPDWRSVATALISGIRQAGIGILPWTPSLRTWQARVRLMRKVKAGAEDWPDLSDSALSADLAEWLTPWLVGMTALTHLTRVDLQSALRGRLSRPQLQLLDALAPTHITVPSGARRPVDYSGDQPVLAVRVQEMFGTADTPAIAGGRLPLQLHLLSPAGRPAQITRDLAGFWRNSYPAVRKELKGRYPKHYWPDDPLAAAPTAHAKPRRGGQK